MISFVTRSFFLPILLASALPARAGTVSGIVSASHEVFAFSGGSSQPGCFFCPGPADYRLSDSVDGFVASARTESRSTRNDWAWSYGASSVDLEFSWPVLHFIGDVAALGSDDNSVRWYGLGRARSRVDFEIISPSWYRVTLSDAGYHRLVDFGATEQSWTGDAASPACIHVLLEEEEAGVVFERDGQMGIASGDITGPLSPGRYHVTVDVEYEMNPFYPDDRIIEEETRCEFDVTLEVDSIDVLVSRTSLGALKARY